MMCVCVCWAFVHLVTVLSSLGELAIERLRPWHVILAHPFTKDPPHRFPRGPDPLRHGCITNPRCYITVRLWHHPLSIGVNGCIPNKSFLRRFCSSACFRSSVGDACLFPDVCVRIIIIPFHFVWIPPFIPDDGRRCWLRLQTAPANCACGS